MDSSYRSARWPGRPDAADDCMHCRGLEISLEGEFHWSWYETEDGLRERMTPDQNKNHDLIPKGARIYRLVSMWPASFSEKAVFPIDFEGRKFEPPIGQCWPSGPEA